MANVEGICVVEWFLNNIWREQLRSSIHLHVMFFYKIRWSHLIFHIGCLFFTWRSCSHPFFQDNWVYCKTINSFRGYMEEIIFDNSYSFEGAQIFWCANLGIKTFESSLLLFRHFCCSHLSFEVGYLFLSQTVAVINSFRNTVFISWENYYGIACFYDANICKPPGLLGYGLYFRTPLSISVSEGLLHIK